MKFKTKANGNPINREHQQLSTCTEDATSIGDETLAQRSEPHEKVRGVSFNPVS